MERAPEETLRAAVELLRQSDRTAGDDWIVSMLLDRVEAAENQAGVLLRAANDLAQANRVLRRERDQLRAALGAARNALVGVARCDDPVQARGIAEAYVMTMEPEDVAEMLLADRRA